MRPPCSAACCATRASPRPEPPGAAVLPREKRPRTALCSSAGRPHPLSSTTIVFVAFSRRGKHDAAGPAVGYRIAHQVVDRQTQPAGPAPDGAQVVIGFDLDVDGTACADVLAGHAVQQLCDIDGFAVLGARELSRGQLSGRGDDRLHPALGPREVLHHLGPLVGGQVRGCAACRGPRASRSLDSRRNASLPVAATRTSNPEWRNPRETEVLTSGSSSTISTVGPAPSCRADGPGVKRTQA